jgi:hypothetical protein
MHAAAHRKHHYTQKDSANQNCANPVATPSYHIAESAKNTTLTATGINCST